MALTLMKGSEAIAEAAIRAGARFFFGYPITPQTEIPEYMSARMPELGGCYLQAESEVAAINMVYGAASTGARVITSSSSPGVSLKQEGISYCAGAQLPCVILNVINIRRPLSGTVERIIRIQNEMQIHSRLRITGMINNTNLSTATTDAELRDGYEMIREVSEKTGIPVAYTSGKREFLDAFLAEGHDPKYIGTPVAIDVYMKRDWDSWVKSV